jgi:hypothetical protein
MGSHYKFEVKNQARKIWLQFAGAFALSFICFPPGVYGYSEPPPDRVLSIAVFIIVTLLMSASFQFGNLYSEKIRKSNSQYQILMWTSILFILFATTSNANQIYKSKDVFIEYAQKWDATDALIKQAISEGKEVVEIPADPGWAGLDLPNQNPKHWVNECYSYFYGIQVFGPP